MPRNATKPAVSDVAPSSWDCLQPDQIAVLSRLLAGESITGAAEAIGVNRTTVHRWLRDDPTFLAAYHRGRRELVDASRAKLLTLVDGAIATIETAIAQGDARVALSLLRDLGITATTEIVERGPQTPADAEREIHQRVSQDMLADTLMHWP